MPAVAHIATICAFENNVIRIQRGSQGWNATFYGPHAAEIVDLFGGNTIPMGFTNAASLDTVRDFVRRTHPGVTIIAKCENLEAYR